MVSFVGVYALLVGVDNLLDYDTNYAFAQRVLSMDSTFADNAFKWRAITDPGLQTAAYLLIIGTELLAGLLCLLGAYQMWSARSAPAAAFNASKELAVAGLFLAFALWFFGFIVVAGEWFSNWQSKDWNVQASAFRYAVCVALVLIFLGQRDEELS